MLAQFHLCRCRLELPRKRESLCLHGNMLPAVLELVLSLQHQHAARNYVTMKKLSQRAGIVQWLAQDNWKTGTHFNSSDACPHTSFVWSPTSVTPLRKCFHLSQTIPGVSRSLPQRHVADCYNHLEIRLKVIVRRTITIKVMRYNQTRLLILEHFCLKLATPL